MRLVANLLCEWEWSGARVPARLVQRTSALGTLVGALGCAGDSLWTPMPVDASRVMPGPGLPTLGLQSGDLGTLEPAPTLAWGETPTTARARPAECALRAAPALAFAREAGLALPDAVVAATVDAVLASPAAARGDRWVAKAPWSASGRERLRGHGNVLSDADRTRLQRLFDAHGDLVVEPWLDRTDDFGGIGIIDGGTVRIIGFHRVLTSGGGAWRGILPLGGEPAPEGLDNVEASALADALRRAGAWLHTEGCQGAFGIDAWRVRGADGAPRLHALGELNARLTFGFVARRLAESAGWSARSAERAPELRVGSASDLEAAGGAVRVLLQPGDDGVAAWLQ